jgi:heptosyltransferase-2
MKSVLIIRLSHLGDVILTEPVVRSIRAANPESRIEFLTRAQYCDAVEMFDGIDRIHALEIPGRDQTLMGLSSTIKRLCSERYDLVVDLHNNLRSWWIKFQLNANKIVTYPKNWRSRRKAVKNKTHTIGDHTVDLYLKALNKADISGVTRLPWLKLRGANEEVGSLLARHELQNRNYAVFAVGASHSPKRFPMNHWNSLAQNLTKSLVDKVVIVDQDYDHSLDLLNELTEAGTVDVITGLELPNLGSILSSARFVVSNDSGVMHLSAAIGTPTVGLFGPTHPVLGFSPLGDHCRALTVNEFCSPCSKHGAKECYREERFCFTKMSNEMILSAIREVADIE